MRSPPKSIFRRYKKKMAAEVHAFQTKVSKLLKLLANSLYSNKEVFLRELVSNASDAIDKLRFESISHPELLQGDPAFAVRIRADKEAGTLTISDNGKDLVYTAGTLLLWAGGESGTAAEGTLGRQKDAGRLRSQTG